MRRSSRRRLLAGLSGGLAAVSGCIAQWGSADEDDSSNGVVWPPEDTSSGPPPAGDDQNAPTGDEDPPDPIEAASDAVVGIRGQGAEAPGIGFVVPGEAVVTNEGLVAAGGSVEVIVREETRVPAFVRGTDPHSDLAVLGLDRSPPVSQPLRFAADRVTVDQSVAAVARTATATTRHEISDVNLGVESAGGLTIPDCFQTDPPVDPDRRGSPIVTEEGDVLGIVSAAGEGIGISGALARRVVPALLAEGAYRHPFLGITPVRDEEATDLDGVMIAGIDPNGPAAAAGLRPAKVGTVGDSSGPPAGGDVILAIEDTPTPTPTDLRTYLALETRPEEAVAVSIDRDGAERTESVTLGTRPPEPIEDRVAYQHPHEYGYDPAEPPVDGFAHLWRFDGSGPPFSDQIGDSNLTVGRGSIATGNDGIYGEDAVAIDRSGYLIHGRGVDVDTSRSFSMGAWIAPERTADYQAAFLLQHAGEGEALGIGINSGRDVSRPHTKVMSIDRTNEWGPTSFGYGEWHLHVLRYDAGSGTAELWFDGDFDYEITVEDAASWVHRLSSGQVVSGFRPASSRDYPFVGRIAWPWIAQGLIAPADIQTLLDVVPGSG